MPKAAKPQRVGRCEEQSVEPLFDLRSELTETKQRVGEKSNAYFLAARRCQRVFFSIFLCFFLRMRLRRFLISDPMGRSR